MRIFSLFVVLAWVGCCSAIAQVGFIANDACFGQQTALVDTSGYADSLISKWAWDFDNDGAFDDGWGKTANYIFASKGSVPVGLKIYFKDGSVDSTTRNIQIWPLPEVNFYVDNLCEDEYAVFTDNSSITTGTIAGYYWDFNSDGNADEIGATVQYNHGIAGVYATTLECVSDAGCRSNTSKQNQVFAKPIVDFSTSGTSYAGSSTFFTNNSSIIGSSIDVYVWDFGDGESSALQNPTHNFKAAQTYTVQLVAISDKSCRDTLSKDILVVESETPAEEPGIESEVVTPNGDGINDVLQIKGVNQYAGCSVTVYNRWNDQVYSNSAYDNDELSGFTGSNLDAGAYFYIIQCDDTELMGTINILK